MKTERINLIVEPSFKAMLVKQAEEQGISVAELIRRQFDQSESEAVLEAFMDELLIAMDAASASMQAGIDRVDEVLNKCQ